MVRALCRVQYLKKFGKLRVVSGKGGRKLLYKFHSKCVKMCGKSKTSHGKIRNGTPKFFGNWFNQLRFFFGEHFQVQVTKIPWDLLLKDEANHT